MKKLLLFLLMCSLAFADTPPPGALELRGATDGTLIGNTGNALNVNVVGGGGSSTVNQGTPAIPANAWPVYLPSPIPSQHVTVDNFPSPVPTQNVNVTNFPSTQAVSGTVNVGNFPSPVPTQTVTGSVSVSNFPSPVPTQSVSVVNFPSTQNVSVSNTPNVTITNPSTNYSLETGGNLASINASLNSINTKFTNPLPVSVGNFPSTQNVNVTNTVPITGNVGVTGTVTVSGTVTANIGTTNGLALNSTLSTISGQLPSSLGQKTSANSFTVVLASDQSPIPISGSITANNASVGTNGSAAPGFSTEIGAVDGSSNLQHLNITAGGALKVDGSGATQPVSGTVAVSNFPSTQNVNVTNTVPVTGTFFQSVQPVSQSGSWSVGRTWVLNSSVDSVTVANFPATFAVTQSTSPWVVSGTVTSNIGTTNGLALDATVSGLHVAQGSTTSGQTGELIQGAVTTSVPSYTTGKTNPLSLTLAGGLRVDGSATTQPVSGTGNFTVIQPTGSNLHTVLDSGSVTVSNQITNYAQETGGNLAAINTNTAHLAAIDTNVSTIATNTTAISSNTSSIATSNNSILANQTNGSQKTSVSSSVLPTDSINSGNLTSLVSVVTIPSSSVGEGGVFVSGTFSGGITINGSITGGMYQQIPTLQAGIWTLNPITVPGFYKFKDSSGFQTVNAFFITYTSGSANITLEGSSAINDQNILQANQALLNATVFQPTGTNLHTVVDSGTIVATQSGTWPVQISNGVNTVAIKGASTAPTMADPSLVVAISPNSPISVTSNPPTNTNVVGTLTAACATGVSCGAGSTVNVTTSGSTSMGFETHGTWSATITQDVSFDANCASSPGTVIWYQVPAIDTDNDSNAQILTWGAGLNNDPWTMNVAGVQCARLRALAYTSGTVNVTLDVGVGTANILAVDVGNVASGALDVGNPIKVGGIYHASLPTFTDGNRADLQLDVNGRLVIRPLTSADVVTANQGGTWNINNISGTVSLPTGAATSALQSTINTSINSFATQNHTDITSSEPRKMQDGAGNNLTSQVNGSQRALDIGIDVAGVQVDPRARTWVLSSGTDSVASVQSGSWTVTANQGTTPWVNNISQFGGSNVVTGVGASGSGIPRVTVSNDSNILATQSGTWNITNITGTVSLPTGAATSANQSTMITDLVNINTSVQNTQGSVGAGTLAANSNLVGLTFNTIAPTVVSGQQVAMQGDSSGNLKVNLQTSIPAGANNIGSVNQGTSPWVDNITQFGGSNVVTGTGAGGSGIPRVTVSNDSNILATQSGTWNLNNISGTISLPTGAATAANQATEITDLGNINTSIQNTQGSVGAGIAATKSDLTGLVFNTAAPAPTNGQQVALQGDASANLKVNLQTAIPAGTNTIGTVNTVAPTASSATLTNVSNSASSFSLLASNANRKGVFLYNNSGTSCNVAFASTASTSAFSFVLTTHSTYTMTPPIYTGAISAICNAGSGNTQVTEF